MPAVRRLGAERVGGEAGGVRDGGGSALGASTGSVRTGSARRSTAGAATTGVTTLGATTTGASGSSVGIGAEAPPLPEHRADGSRTATDAGTATGASGSRVGTTATVSGAAGRADASVRGTVVAGCTSVLHAVPSHHLTQAGSEGSAYQPAAADIAPLRLKACDDLPNLDRATPSLKSAGPDT